MRRSSDTNISNRLSRYIPLPLLRALYGFLLAMGAPVGWVLVQYAVGRAPFSAENIDHLLYGYMIITTVIVFSAIGYGIGKREKTITDMALSDALTALYNKRYFKNRIEQEFERHQRHGTPLTIIQIDLDFFKKVNDSWGHQAGDEVLKKISAVILANCRKNEIAARVGGEEICIIGCDCTGDDAFHLAERLRTEIENTTCHWQGQIIKVTASFGVAAANSKTTNAWQVYQHADEALYQAKQSGRNKVCVYAP